MVEQPQTAAQGANRAPDKKSTSLGPDKAIRDFEEKLKEPMLPDFDRAVKKAEKKFPHLLRRVGWAIALFFAVMYAAIGLNGVLIFLGGVLSLVAIQAALLFRYVVNENYRAQLKREEMEKVETFELGDFVVVDEKEESRAQPDAPKVPTEQKTGQGSSTQMKTSDLLTEDAKLLKMRTDMSGLGASHSLSIEGQLAVPERRQRSNSQEQVGQKPDDQIDVVSVDELLSNNGSRLGQDLAPPQVVAEDDANLNQQSFLRLEGTVRPVSAPLDRGATFGSDLLQPFAPAPVFGTRKLDRPAFLSDCFEEPEPQFFYMFKECFCASQRSIEIQSSFMGKHKGVAEGLQGVARFFQLMASSKIQTAQVLQALGEPSKSFLGSYATSILFEEEGAVFNYSKGADKAQILFCEIRGLIQRQGKVLFQKASDWIEEAQDGQLAQVESKFAEFGVSFEDQYEELSRRVNVKAQELHQRENIYHATEEKLIDMIAEYRELIKVAEASKGQQKEQASDAQATAEPAVARRKTYSELVHVESQCKITHYELNNQSLQLKDAFLQLTEAIEEFERFKAEMVDQMQDLVVEQAKVMLSTIKAFFTDLQSFEQLSLKQFEYLLEKNPRQMVGPFVAPLAKVNSLLEIDEIEEANLSEFNGGSPTRNVCERYSDLRGSGATLSARNSQYHRNDSRSLTPPRLNLKTVQDNERNGDFISANLGSNQKLHEAEDRLSPLRSMGAAEREERVSICVDEPSDNTPRAESTPRGNNREGDPAPKKEVQADQISNESPKSSLQNISFEEFSDEGDMVVQEDETGGDLPAKTKYEKAKEQTDADDNQLQKITLAMDEMTKYLNDLAGVNELEGVTTQQAVDSQFKEIKNVITGVNLSIEDVADEDMLRASIAENVKTAMARTESKRYGPSTKILALKSDFDSLCGFWEGLMEEKRHSAEQYAVTAKQLRLQADTVQAQFGKIKDKLVSDFLEVNSLDSRVEQLKTDVDNLKQSIDSLEAKKAEEQVLKEETKEIEATQKTQSLEQKQTDESHQEGSALRQDTLVVTGKHSQDVPKTEKKVKSAVNLRSLLEPKKSKVELAMTKNMTSLIIEKSKSDAEQPTSSTKVRSQSLDDLPPNLLHPNSSRKSSGGKFAGNQSFSVISMQNILPGEALDEAPGIESKPQRAHSPALSLRSKTLEPLPQAETPRLGVHHNTQQSSFGQFFTNLISVFTSEQQQQSMHELQERLAAQKQELERVQNVYLRKSKQLHSDFMTHFEQLKNTVEATKEYLLTQQIERSRLVIKYGAESDLAQVVDSAFTNSLVIIQAKSFMFTNGRQVSFHAPHCENYRLLSTVQSDNPFAIKVEEVAVHESAHDCQSAQERNEESVSVASARPSENPRTIQRLPTPVNVNDRENVEWVNDLLAVLYEAWTDAKVFHDLVLDGIYNAVNLDRDSSLAEIKCEALQLEGKPPRIVWVKNAAVKHPKTGRPCFTIEGDAVVPGKVKILVSTAYKINWPAINWTQIDVQLLIIVSRISGRIRFQYSNDVEHHGGSYLQFLGRPAVKVDIEPVIFKKSPINLQSIPTVKTLLKDIVNDVIESLCFPNRVEMSVPCVHDAIWLDEAGKRIPRTPEKAPKKKSS